MIGLMQRVTRATVEVDGTEVVAIGRGALVLVGVERDDTEAQAERLADRLISYRIFSDGQDRLNLALTAVGGGLLLVPQFTLAADTTKGMRPSFSSAAEPARGRVLFDHLVRVAMRKHEPVACGVFGANMQVSLVNDGPVTFQLRVKPGKQ